MNAPMTKFAIMRANREKQRQIAAYGRVMASIDRAVLGLPEKVQRPFPQGGIVYTNAPNQFIENERAAKRAWES